MEKDRSKKLVMIAALVAVFSLTIGFAAFSGTLNITSNATVTPDSSDFSVLFSSSNTSQATANITGVGTGGATGGSAVISGTTISGLSANFTEPGQKVTYTFYVHNAGEYVAYLSDISFGSGKTCTAGTGATNSLVQAACEDISISVKVGDLTTSTNTSVTDHGLAIDAYEKVVVTIEYKPNGSRADGNFSISFGDIRLIYSSLNGFKLLNFTFRNVQYQAEEGMTWGEWVNSKYNTDQCSVDACDRVICGSFLVGEAIASGKITSREYLKEPIAPCLE